MGAGEAIVTVSYAGNDRYASAEDKTIDVLQNCCKKFIAILNIAMVFFGIDCISSITMIVSLQSENLSSYRLNAL